MGRRDCSELWVTMRQALRAEPHRPILVERHMTVLMPRAVLEAIVGKKRCVSREHGPGTILCGRLLIKAVELVRVNCVVDRCVARDRR